MSNKLIALWDRFKSREYRESFIESHLSSTIAAQIFSMRSDRNMTQAELAIKAGMQQTRICVLEDPDNTSMSIKTLRRIAAAFDVALIIRFVPYSAVARWAAEANSQKFSVPSFDEDGEPEAAPRIYSLSAVTPSQSQRIVVSAPMGNVTLTSTSQANWVGHAG